MKRLFITLFFVLLSISLTAQIEWRNDRTGIYSSETGLLKSWPADGPEMLWYIDGLGEGHSSAGIASDKLYITGMHDDKGYLYVFDLNGKLLNKIMYGDEWHINYPGTRATPVVNDGKVYLMSGTGDLVCLDESSLEVVWKRNIFKDFDAKNIRWGYNETPLIVGEKIIFTPGGKNHNIVALNKNDGQLIWSSPAKGDLSAYCSPLFIGDQEVPLIVTMTAAHIVGIDATNGKMLWSVVNKNKNSIHANTPVYSDNMIFCASADKSSVMLQLLDGGRKVKTAWEIPELDNLMTALVKIGDHIYGSSSGYNGVATWYCVDWVTGTIRYRDRQLAAGVPIFAGGMLYCYTDKGDMALVEPSPEKFNVVSKFTITKGTGPHWAHPVIYKGVLYVRHGDTLMAYAI